MFKHIYLVMKKTIVVEGGASLEPAQRIHITEREFGATLPYQVRLVS
jgi:hypothetical protein